MKDAESPEVGNSRKWLLSLGLKTNEGTVSGRAAATGEKPLVKGYSYYQIKVQEGGKYRDFWSSSGLLPILPTG